MTNNGPTTNIGGMPNRTPPPPIPLVANINSNVRRLCDKRGWNKNQFVAACLAKSICGVDTANKLYAGDANVQLQTAANLAQFVFEVPIASLFELESKPAASIN